MPPFRTIGRKVPLRKRSLIRGVGIPSTAPPGGETDSLVCCLLRKGIDIPEEPTHGDSDPLLVQNPMQGCRFALRARVRWTRPPYRFHDEDAFLIDKRRTRDPPTQDRRIRPIQVLEIERGNRCPSCGKASEGIPFPRDPDTRPGIHPGPKWMDSNRQHGGETSTWQAGGFWTSVGKRTCQAMTESTDKETNNSPTKSNVGKIDHHA